MTLGIWLSRESLVITTGIEMSGRDVICILVYAVTLYNSCQITSVYYVGHWTDCGPLNNIGRDVQHRRCAAAIPRTVLSFREKIWTWTRFNGHV